MELLVLLHLQQAHAGDTAVPASCVLTLRQALDLGICEDHGLLPPGP